MFVDHGSSLYLEWSASVAAVVNNIGTVGKFINLYTFLHLAVNKNKMKELDNLDTPLE